MIHIHEVNNNKWIIIQIIYVDYIMITIHIIHIHEVLYIFNH